MDSIQTKIEAIRADKNNLKTACVAPGSLCNIKVGEGRVIIANQYKMSPLEVTDVMKVDREVPKATYCIAIPDNVLSDMLGREVVLDMSYGGKGVPLSHKIKILTKSLLMFLVVMITLELSKIVRVLKIVVSLLLVKMVKLNFGNVILFLLIKLVV